MKRPWLAGMLNVIPGLGYLYVSRQRLFGWFLVAADLLFTVGVAFSPTTDSSQSASADMALTVWDWMIFFGVVSGMVAFIVDARLAAIQANQAAGK